MPVALSADDLCAETDQRCSPTPHTIVISQGLTSPLSTIVSVATCHLKLQLLAICDWILPKHHCSLMPGHEVLRPGLVTLTSRAEVIGDCTEYMVPSYLYSHASAVRDKVRGCREMEFRQYCRNLERLLAEGEVFDCNSG
jgi:hypothetical protein